jgi:hypothetical protein
VGKKPDFLRFFKKIRHFRPEAGKKSDTRRGMILGIARQGIHSNRKTCAAHL